MEREIAGYALENAEIQLFSSDAARLRELVRRGDVPAAIELYFSAAGQRWDAEWLAIRNVQIPELKPGRGTR